MVPVCKRLQEPIDLLGLFGQFNLHQQLSNSHINGVSEKGESSHVLSQRSLVELVARERENASNPAFGDAFLQTSQVFRRRIILLAWWI